MVHVQFFNIFALVLLGWYREPHYTYLRCSSVKGTPHWSCVSKALSVACCPRMKSFCQMEVAKRWYVGLIGVPWYPGLPFSKFQLLLHRKSCHKNLMPYIQDDERQSGRFFSRQTSYLLNSYPVSICIEIWNSPLHISWHPGKSNQRYQCDLKIRKIHSHISWIRNS